MPDEEKPARRGTLALGFLLVVGVHCVGVAYFAPPSALLGPDPPMFDAHGITELRLFESNAFSQPGGLLGWIVAALARPGLDRLRMYGALLLVFHLCVPLIGMAAARRARASASATLVTGALFSALWWFDSLTHWCWYSGRIGWLVVSVAVPLVLAEASRRGRRLGPFVGVGALAAAVVPLAEPTGVVFSSRASLLVHDFLDVLSDGYGAEGNVRAAIRVTVWTAAAFTLYERGRGDTSARIWGSFWGVSVALAYLGGYLPVAWPLDPYLMLVPATFAAALPAAELMARAASPTCLRQVEPSARLVLLLALLVATPRLVRTMLTYVPEGMPERVIRAPGDLRVSAAVGPNERAPDPLRHLPPPASCAALATRLIAAAPTGSVFAREREVAAYLAIHTDLAILGPLALRGDADPSADTLDTRHWRGAALAETLRQRGIEWTVVAGPADPLERRRDVFEPVAFLDAVRLYRVRAYAPPG